MKTLRRWYQLSMLQMLMVMAVVALLCWLNLRTTNSKEDLSDNLGLKIVEVRAGWPFTFRTAKAIVLTGSASTQPKEAGRPAYLWLPLTDALIEYQKSNPELIRLMEANPYFNTMIRNVFASGWVRGNIAAKRQCE